LRYINSRRVAALGLGALIGVLSLSVGPAAAQSGGIGTPGSTETTTTPTSPVYGPPQKARLTKKGVAIPPPNAPPAVVNAINYGNFIRKQPYRWGGGHASFYDTGYDCSGAVSFVLWGAGLLTSPMPSGSFTTWGLPGKGQWLTVYANKSHIYAVIAGLRWDTSSVGERFRRGSGPRWRASKRKPKGYAIRHYPGY
jgi:hypothetical protein